MPSSPTRAVEVQPAGVSLEPRADETVIEAAWRAGYYWPTVCGGRAECRSCVLVVVAGVEHTGTAGPEERRQLELVARPPQGGDVRLACRMVVDGPVQVHKRGVRLRPT